jgi:methionyl-tRNA formyltransferase
MKIVYMGTPDFATAPLKALIEGGHEILCVLTRADKPRGRGQEMSATPVALEAEKYGIPVMKPLKMKDPELLKKLRDFQADVFVVAAYGKLLPPELLSIPPFGCVNIHASLLPAYRGAAPVQWAILDGQKETGITTMQMDAGLDTGDILKQYRIPIAENETGGSLFDRLRDLGAKAILDTLSGLEAGSVTPVKQGETTTEYAKMLTREMGDIDWNEPALKTERLIRALNPWPGTYTGMNGKQLKIWRSHIDGGTGKGQPGEIVSAEDGRLLVSTGEGLLSIDELQMEGKKRMDAASFLRGNRLQTGDRFTKFKLR